MVVGGWVGVVDFQSSPGFNMTGFYGEMVYWVHSRVFVQEERFWVVLEVVGTRYRVQTGGFVGISGWMVVTVVIPMVLVAG